MFPHVSLPSSHGLTCLLSGKMEFLLGNPFTTPVGHCIGKELGILGTETRCVKENASESLPFCVIVLAIYLRGLLLLAA